MIRARNLKKVFGEVVAVNSINLEIKKGEIYGFLGPNGAGKTTTIRMLTGTLKPTSGEIEILGIPLDKNEIEIKKRIGVVFEEPKLYENLKGTEFIDFIIAIYKLDREKTLAYLSELTEAFNIDYLDGFIGDYSHGMKQKLALVSVLMRKPEVVFLDEPTVGLDARSAKILKMLLEKITSEGRTIFMTTHILEIAEKMCSRIGIINRGELIAEGTLKELRKLSKTGSKSLEDLFLELTGGEEIAEIVEAL
ncbi:MAG TPA: ABC transporter ATP-binding protein [candidate division WOR-3 bacterium]|uniref:ABC transporter ATP-binding protein n=1 Tax=candidate division WOR-3 bacterium TaxID=2052148 RepID=A0A7C0ZCU9_UNCW3|nr:ABC transporter ATP-binding protein [candidate division WOR-3 bacterium]